MTTEEQLERMRRIADDALRHWNLGGARLDLLKHRENAVFRASTGDQRFALRVHRPGYHGDDALRSELQWMDALGEAGIDVPRIVLTDEGKLFATVPAPDMPAPVQVDLFEWIDGRQLGSVEAGVAGGGGAVHVHYRQLGQLAAAVHNQAERWMPPPSFVRHAWDEEGLAGEQPFWGRFLELEYLTREQRKLLAAARDRVYRALGALPKDPAGYTMIHADFTPENLLVQGERVRLIDFDDAGFGWHLFELVTPLFFLMDEPYFELARDALISGYRQKRRLDEEQLLHLPLFFLARSFTYLSWVHSRPETATAQELTPMLVESSCALAEEYLGGR